MLFRSPVELQKEDFELVCKKLGFTHKELEQYISRSEKSHLEYGNDENLYSKILQLNKYKKMLLEKK